MVVTIDKDSIQGMHATQQLLVTSMVQYQEILKQVSDNYAKIYDSHGNILSVIKKQTEAEREQLEVTKDLAKSRAEAIAGAANTLTKMVKDPFDEIAKATKEAADSNPFTKAIAGAVVLAAAIGEAYINIQRFHEAATRTAGLSVMEGLGGLGNSMLFDARMAGASALKYSNNQEYIGAAGALIGQGGLRGDALMQAMEDLPQKTHEAGLGFVETAIQMAHLTRVTGDSIPNIKKSFDDLSETAKVSKYPVQDYVNAVVDLTLKTHKYGGSLDTSTTALQQNYQQVLNGIMTTPELLSNLESASTMLAEHGKDTNTAFATANNMVATFGKAVGDMSIKWADLLSITESMTSQFGMSTGEAEGLAQYLINTHEQLHIATSDLKAWHEAMAKGSVTMFDSPKEAAYSAAIATKLFAKQFQEGTVTVGDYNVMLKIHRDVFQDSGASVIGKFEQLSKIVAHSNIRMEEMTGYLSQSYKMFRQYGIEEMGMGIDVFKKFNQYVREGAIAIQDYQAILKGPAGASEGMRAMLYENMSKMSGSTGAAFRNAGVLGSIDVLLPALQRAAGGTASTAEQQMVEKAFNTDNKGIQAIQAELVKQLQKNISGMVSSGTGEFEQMAMFNRMFGQFFGSNSSATGGNIKLLMDMATKGTLPEMTSAKAKEEASNSQLMESYKDFGVSVKDFSAAVAQLKSPGGSAAGAVGPMSIGTATKTNIGVPVSGAEFKRLQALKNAPVTPPSWAN